MCRNQRAHAPAQLPRMHLELALDLRLALAALEDDEVLEEPGLVVLEHLHLDRTSGSPARREETVAVCVGARADILDRGALCDLGTPDDERHHAAAIEQHEP